MARRTTTPRSTHPHGDVLDDDFAVVVVVVGWVVDVVVRRVVVVVGGAVVVVVGGAVVVVVVGGAVVVVLGGAVVVVGGCAPVLVAKSPTWSATEAKKARTSKPLGIRGRTSPRLWTSAPPRLTNLHGVRADA
jgi:hypothetical protein